MPSYLVFLAFFITLKLSRCSKDTQNNDEGLYYKSVGRLPPNFEERINKFEEKEKVSPKNEIENQFEKAKRVIVKERKDQAFDFICALIVINKCIMAARKEWTNHNSLGKSSYDRDVNFGNGSSSSPAGQGFVSRRKRQLDEKSIHEFSMAMVKAEATCKMYGTPTLEDTLSNFNKSGVQFEWLADVHEKLEKGNLQLTLKDAHYVNGLVRSYNDTVVNFLVIDGDSKHNVIPQVPSDKCLSPTK